MSGLSYTQEYLLCALNSKGSIPVMNSNRIAVCIVAGGMLELLHNRAVSIGAKKKIVIERNLGENEVHLKPLYDTIRNSKPMTVNDVAGKYVFGTSKKLCEFMEALSVTMKENRCVTPGIGGLFHNKTVLIPNNEEVLKVIEKIRAEFLEQGAVQDETVVLGALLQKSGLIKNYFSKFESQRLKERLEEIKKSEAGSLVKEMADYIDSMMAAIIAASSAGI